MLIKPMSIRKQEFVEQLVFDVNKCELPLFVVELVLQNLLDSVKEAARQQYEAEKAQYEQQLKQNQKGSDELAAKE